MIAALLLAATSVQGNVRTVDLSRGALIQPSDSSVAPFQYWDTSDTFIDGALPEENFGGEPILSGGPFKTVLIRFGDLDRVLGTTRKIRKATLFLTIAGGDKPTLKSADRLITNWNPGPYFTINALINRNIKNRADAKKALLDKPSAPRLSATWKHAQSGDGGFNWQSPGALGPQDSEPIPGVKLSGDDKVVALEGLGPALQAMADHPNSNRGLALHFQNACEFFASRAAIGQPKLELELEPAAPNAGPDLSVTAIQLISKSATGPTDGEDVVYKAHVKNVGSGKTGAFSAVWIINGKSGSTLDVVDPIESGAETVLTSHAPYRLDRTDHRVQTVELKLTPHSADATPGNDSLTIYPSGRMIDVVVPDSVAKQSSVNLLGSHAVEDWAQSQIRIFNESFAAQSRFSFAPDGAKERISIQHILFGSNKAGDGAHSDGVATVAENPTWLGSDNHLIREFGLACGIPDFSSMSFPSGSRIHLKQGDQVVNHGGQDLYPGVLGYGDTRYEGTMAGGMSLPYGPYPSPSQSLLPLIPTGLLSATDVQVLNSQLDHREANLEMPKTTLLKAMDLSGRPLGNIQMDFFQSKGGEILDGPPSFSLTSSPSEGTVLLPTKDNSGPFGKLDTNGGNGTFLIRATSNGVVEWTWLKAWQIIDTASRGNNIAAVLEARFNLPSAPLDHSTNLAKDRIVSDSTNLLPAKLGTLASDSIGQDVELGSKTGDWVEIDLARDRTIGEITLIGAEGSFWNQFDIVVYSTGQKAEEAAIWSKELDWNWTSRNRRDPVVGSDGAVSVSYCSQATRIRFVRIINRSNNSGKLKSIRVTPVKIAQ